MTLHERQVGGVTIVDINGRVTAQEGGAVLRDTLDQLTRGDGCKVLLNCEHVPYIDTTGICEIVRGYTAATRRGGSLKLMNLTPHVQQLLTVTRLSTILEVFPEEGAALESFGPAPV
jgi:anti-sigma B factor antagonist